MLTSLLLRLCVLVLVPCDAAHRGRVMRTAPVDSPVLSFSSSWQILGPFQIGTREPTWGADPLEYSRRFPALQYDPDARYPSSLPANGTATWNLTEATQTASSSTSANATLSISYSNVDWDFLRVVYGWAASQYQCWARGELTVSANSTLPVVLHTDTVLEYYVDDVHYFGGDFFTYRKAPPVLHLTPGAHTIELRLVRDVRAFGGVQEPTIDVLIDVQKASGTLELAQPGILMADVVSDKLATPVGSVFVRNTGEDDVEILDIRSSSVRPPLSLHERDLDTRDFLAHGQRVLTADQETANSSNTTNAFDVTVIAGQTRPVAFNISLPANNVSSVNYTMTYRTIGSSQTHVLKIQQELNRISMYEPQKITYLHPGGMVSYSMLRPPAQNATCHAHESTKLPVLLQLHGAGLEADNGQVAHALDPVSDLCAWVLFPTGVTPWSGDDWHNWGFADVEAAVNNIPEWMNNIDWSGPGVDVDRWIVSGHSNGGQGTWFTLTHRPDKILAAAPVSGFASVQKYVPYELWQPADPRRTAVISGSLNSYRHEMLMSNAHGIPVQQQHGEIDDNVPAYNSRLLRQQLFLSGTNSSYNEVPGRNHWWDGVMTTPQLVDFYYEAAANNDTLPRELDEYSFVVGDPGDMGSKGGIRVLHLEDPGQYGKVDVKGHVIRTSNVLSMEFGLATFQRDSVMLDGMETSLDGSGTAVFSKNSGVWQAGSPQSVEGSSTRRGRQLGSMTAILRTHGPFVIRHDGSSITSHLALQTSRNLHQYFQADTHIVSSSAFDVPDTSSGNVVTLALGTDLPVGLHSDFPIQVNSDRITVRDSRGDGRGYTSKDDLTGAAYLRPLEGERLELVLWGVDAEGLSQAARLVPLLTGVGQPDFVVLGKSAKWKGVEGTLAMGFFNYEWEVAISSMVS